MSKVKTKQKRVRVNSNETYKKKFDNKERKNSFALSLLHGIVCKSN